METTKKSTFKVLFYLKKNAPKKNGMVPIMCRITINGSQSAFSTKLDISVSNWDLKYGRVLGKSREAQNINGKLDKIRLNMEECYSKILKNEGNVNSIKLKNVYLGLGNGELTFFKFCEKFLLDFEKKVDNGLRSKGTLGKYNILFTHLKGFALSKYGYSDVHFNDLTYEFVQEFDYYLRDEQSLEHNTIWLYMIGFTIICRLAISRKHLAFNPFSEYKNTKKDKDRGYLLRNELEQLVTFNCEKKKDELVKDLFVFSCFTGLSYSDMKGLKNSNIQDFFDGNKWIIVRRKKTATSSNVMLLDIPNMIIEKYAGIAKQDKVFPVPSNTTCNDSLMRISQQIDCLKEKKVTFHLARHTFATLFLSEGVPLESLSKMLGHKNIATTQIYAKILNEKVGKDMQKVSHKFKGMEQSFVTSL
ncbi:site-specific integrase [Flavobacterium sp. xlx-214]|uniref:site-specific integrase n=1 Tax=unclassified Flavobacterium TaxID=196869 RepID=UPI0013D7AD21|nr:MULTISPECIES: site-specific integrase [unclassified Flavobacterium]MBA5793522.1 site-specific integrase [Flavobacterium sp. xlx-221]QMI82708.1 site-specific integrase [Flavobacterium sp. xlx-214]